MGLTHQGGSCDIFVVGRKKILTRKPEIGAPNKPDPKKPLRGGKKRTRLFASYLFEGFHPYEAYIKAGFPVLGVRGPSGEPWTKGMTIEAAKTRAGNLAQSPKVQGMIAVWSIPPEQLLEQMKSESAFVLHKALQARDEYGHPTARAINAADSILDRTGLGRGSKLALEHKGHKRGTQEFESLRQNVLEAMRRDGLLEVSASPQMEVNGQAIRRLPEDPSLVPGSGDHGED